MIDIRLLKTEEINIISNKSENTVIHIYYDDFDFLYAHNSYYICYLKISYILKNNIFIDKDSLISYLKCFQNINIGKDVNDAAIKIQNIISSDLSLILNTKVSVSITNTKEQFIYLNNYSDLENELDITNCTFTKLNKDFGKFIDYKYEQYKLKTNLIKHKYNNIDLYSTIWIRCINGNQFNIEDLYHYLNNNKNLNIHPINYTLDLFNKLYNSTDCEKFNIFNLYKMKNRIDMLICCETPKGQFSKKYINEYVRISNKWE